MILLFLFFVAPHNALKWEGNTTSCVSASVLLKKEQKSRKRIKIRKAKKKRYAQKWRELRSNDGREMTWFFLGIVAMLAGIACLVLAFLFPVYMSLLCSLAGVVFSVGVYGVATVLY